MADALEKHCIKEVIIATRESTDKNTLIHDPYSGDELKTF